MQVIESALLNQTCISRPVQNMTQSSITLRFEASYAHALIPRCRMKKRVQSEHSLMYPLPP
jgi:hypothetical protein